MNFDDTIITYSAEEAMAEANRCLDCHQICSLCVGVCPNMALMTYESEPFSALLPSLEIAGDKIVVGDSTEFHADQAHQIAVLTDFCNECGNCVTFCPTSGEPYRDKPRLYLDRLDFEAQPDNAFMLIRNGKAGTPRYSTRRSGERGSDTVARRLRLDVCGARGSQSLDASTALGSTGGRRRPSHQDRPPWLRRVGSPH
jgi:ferredoxin